MLENKSADFQEFKEAGDGFRRFHENNKNKLEQLSNDGNADASCSLYEHYKYHTKNSNEEEALKYLEKAAERRNLQIVRTISYYYLHGKKPYLNKNFKKTFHYYETLSTTLTNKTIYYLGKDYQLVTKYQLAVM